MHAATSYRAKMKTASVQIEVLINITYVDMGLSKDTKNTEEKRKDLQSNKSNAHS